MLYNLASSSAGAVVSLATSSDEDHPAETIIDGEPSTFWMTTGMFPQEVVVTFASLKSVSSIHLQAASVKEVRFQKCVSEEPIIFEEFHSETLDFNEGSSLQNVKLTTEDLAVRHLKIIIEQGHQFFASIHALTVDGKAKIT